MPRRYIVAYDFLLFADIYETFYELPLWKICIQSILQEEKSAAVIKDNSCCNQGYISSGKRCQGTFYSYSGYTYCAEKMTSHSLLSPLFVSLDVNECASSNGGCDQICTNKPGTYQCSCNQGYISSGKRCQGIILILCLKILSRENEISHLNISALCFFRR